MDWNQLYNLRLAELVLALPLFEVLPLAPAALVIRDW